MANRERGLSLARARVPRAPILAISGPSGSGKTRLLARLLPLLAARGLSVAAVKHTRHRHRIDVPGKDTDLLRQAGARAVALSGPSGTAFFFSRPLTLKDLVRMVGNVDLILAEGFKEEPLPRVEVHRSAVSRSFLCATDPLVVAVVSDVAPPKPLPLFDPENVPELARFILAWMRRVRRSTKTPRKRLGAGTGRQKRAVRLAAVR